MNAIYPHQRDHFVKDFKTLTEERSRLAVENIKLAHKFARIWPFPGMDKEDNEGEALFTFCCAAANFRPELGWKFSTYAAVCHLNKRKSIYKQIAAPHKDANIIFARFTHEDLKDWEPRSGEMSVEEQLEIWEDIEQKLQILKVLDPRSKEIVRRKAAGEKLGQIGKDLGLSRQRIQQIHAHSMAKLGMAAGRRRPKPTTYEQFIEQRRERTAAKREEWHRRLDQMRELARNNPGWTSRRLSLETGICDRICRKYIQRAKQCTKS